MSVILGAPLTGHRVSFARWARAGVLSRRGEPAGASAGPSRDVRQNAVGLPRWAASSQCGSVGGIPCRSMLFAGAAALFLRSRLSAHRPPRGRVRIPAARVSLFEAAPAADLFARPMRLMTSPYLSGCCRVPRIRPLRHRAREPAGLSALTNRDLPRMAASLRAAGGGFDPAHSFGRRDGGRRRGAGCPWAGMGEHGGACASAAADTPPT